MRRSRILATACVAAGLMFAPLSASVSSPAQAQTSRAAAKPIPEGTRDLSAVWWARTYSPRLIPADGSAVPFTPKGQEQYRSNMEALRAGTMEDHSRVWCSPDGLPRSWTQPYPLRIVQTGSHAAIIYESNATYRLIAMETAVPPEIDWLPYFMGNSYGRWDGDTLVIDVVGFKAVTTFLDDTGLPHSDQLRLTERLRKLGNTQLEVVVTITDPVMFTRPWDTRFVFERREDIQHFDFWVCGETHRDTSQVQGAPR